MSKHDEWIENRRKLLYDLITKAYLESITDFISFGDSLELKDVPESFRKACFAIYDMALEDGEALAYKKRQSNIEPNDIVLFPGDDGYDEFIREYVIATTANLFNKPIVFNVEYPKL